MLWRSFECMRRSVRSTFFDIVAAILFNEGRGKILLQSHVRCFGFPLSRWQRRVRSALIASVFDARKSSMTLLSTSICSDFFATFSRILFANHANDSLRRTCAWSRS